MMTSVVETIQQLGVEVEHIADGCTSPLSTCQCWNQQGIEKMLVHKAWEDWMLDSSINVSVVKRPTLFQWTYINILGGMEFILGLI